MAILKNINETGTDLALLFDRNDYVTAPLKTKLNLVGALRCSPENFPKISRSLKRLSHQENSKMLRHFVVSISPCDENKLSDAEILVVARKVSEFFKDCYVLYAVHKDTAHTHFHILICNTRISDGNQMSMSDSDLERFKEHCSSVLREHGLRPIEKMDKSDEQLEIDETLFPQPPAELSQQERVDILYEGVDNQPFHKPYYGNYRPAPVQNYITVNVLIPPGTQGTLFQGRNGQPCLSFKPSQTYYPQSPVGNIPHNGAVYGGNTLLPAGDPQFPSDFSEWNEEEPAWLKDPQPVSNELDECEDVSYPYEDECDDDFDYRYDDLDNGCDDKGDEGDDDYVSPPVVTVPPNGNGNVGAAAAVSAEKTDPIVVIKGLANTAAASGNNNGTQNTGGKIDPFVFRDKPLEKVFPYSGNDNENGGEKICPIIVNDNPKKF
ncbi:MAG: relaxase/mobilization nuclease domain-containing protein [Lachnospiraceae bacterium]|nr:relaxase/mobilization nuclease domain-containing protein [Ruminococcus sp.]MCM1276955.1 relaxase/mobilization nuclease domain-containing protein [Lachnospiraceae bacterium]